MSNVVALTVGGVGFIWLVYLLNAGRLGGVSFVLGMGVIAAVSLAIAPPERLQELWLGKGIGFKLREVQQIRDDIYAKVETVNRIAEATARLAAEAVATQNRFVDHEQHTERMLQRRSDIAAMLRGIGFPGDRITELVQPITDAALLDHKSEVRIAILSEAQAGPRPPDTEMQEELWTLLLAYEPDNRSVIEDWARRAQGHSPAVAEALDRLDAFIRDEG